MSFTVSVRHSERTDAVTGQVAESLLETVRRLAPTAGDGHLTISNDPDGIGIKCQLSGPGLQVHCEAHGSSYDRAMEELVERIDAQLERRRGRQRRRGGRPAVH
jgi:ribosome-associated translation inhibitor RaiA